MVIASAKMVCRKVMDDHNLWVNEFQVRQVMKKDFKLSFIKVKKLAPQANSDLNLVLRQQFALKLMEHLHEGKRVINIDETWMNETSHVRRTWAQRDGSGNLKLNSVTPRLSMIAAVDTDG